MYAHLLPSDASYAPALPCEADSGARRPLTSAPLVLVVDDEILIADTIALILNRNGFQAHAFYNGRDAVDAACRLQPATVLSDVAMPHFDGIEAAIAIRELCPSARIVLFSGQSATPGLLERARVLGHDFELLPKPIHPTELLRRLRAN